MKREFGWDSFSPRWPRAFRLECLVLLAVALVIPQLSGCVAVPIRAPRVKTPASQTLKGKVELDFLKEGLTRKEEVRAQLGHLSAGYENPNLMVVRWLDSQWLLLWAAGGYTTGAAGASRNWGAHTLFIEFDDPGVVRKVYDVPDAKLLLAIRSLANTWPRREPEAAFAVKATHTHTWSQAQIGQLTMTGEEMVFREEGRKKHDFALPLSSVQFIRLHGMYGKRDSPQPNEFMASVAFKKEKGRAQFLLFHVSFPELVTLARFAQDHGLPVK